MFGQEGGKLSLIKDNMIIMQRIYQKNPTRRKLSKANSKWINDLIIKGLNKS